MEYIRHIYSIIGMCLILTIQSCSTAEKKQDNNEYQVVDSILRRTSDIDSLLVRFQTFSDAGNKIGVMLTEKKLGVKYRNAALFTEALRHHRSGLECAKDLNDTLEMVQALNNIGTNFRRMGILDEASKYHYEALLLSEQYSDKESNVARKNRVVSLNGIGNVHLTLDNRVTADSAFRMALAGEKQLGSDLGQAINYANLGAIFEASGSNDSAMTYYRRSMEHNILAGSELGISLCHTYMGRLYEKAGKFDEALTEYEKAYKLMENSRDRWHWLESCMALARIYFAMHNYSKADSYLSKAEATALDIKSWEHLSHIYNLRYQFLKEHNDYRNALVALEKSRIFSDSVWNKENQSHMQNIRVNYEKERNSIEMAMIKQAIEQQRHNNIIVIIIFSLVLLLIVVVIVFMFYALRIKSRNQRLMQHLEKSRNQFFTNVTHEFRTPLTIITGLSEQLKINSDDRETRVKYIDNILNQSNRLLQLVNSLLDVSKVQSAIGEPQWRSGNAVAYIAMIVENHKYYARQKGIDLRFSPAQTNVVMDFVPDYMHKILENLLSNGIKYTDKGGKVYLSTKCSGDNFILNIVDTGRGIAKEDLPHIFEMFYQGNNNSSIVGTGVGLSMVYSMVNSMGGTIKVRSAIGEGTFFSITLPLKHGENQWTEWMSDDLDHGVIHNHEKLIENPIDKKDAFKYTVMIVEDNVDVSFYLGELLRNRYKLIYASNGAEALEKCNDYIPDLIISDIMMPEMDGYQLCRALRASDNLNHLPIIVVTAKCEESDRVKMLDAGIDAYLQKPFNADELMIRIERLLEQRRMLREKYSCAISDTYNNEEVISVADKNFLDRVTNIIFAKISDNSLNSAFIADKMCISRSQLNRKISAITGYSTLAYILQVRIEKAKRMLKHSDEPIGDIAMACGFDDAGYFGRVFKQQVDMTPSQYRKTPLL